MVNSYGYLRAPWNANANKYVTRYSTFCGEDYDNLVLQFPSCKVRTDPPTTTTADEAKGLPTYRMPLLCGWLAG